MVSMGKRSAGQVLCAEGRRQTGRIGHRDGGMDTRLARFVTQIAGRRCDFRKRIATVVRGAAVLHLHFDPGLHRNRHA